MGMDLVGAGFTRRNDVKCDIDAIDAIINAIPDEKLEDEAFLNAIDPSGYLGSDMDDSWEGVRDALKEGAREFDSALMGHRMSTSFTIAGSPLEFVWAGGGSWGDDPWDGFTSLCYFINFAEQDIHVRYASGFVCGGLPSKLLIASIGEPD